MREGRAVRHVGGTLAGDLEKIGVGRETRRGGRVLGAHLVDVMRNRRFGFFRERGFGRRLRAGGEGEEEEGKGEGDAAHDAEFSTDGD